MLTNIIYIKEVAMNNVQMEHMKINILIHVNAAIKTVKHVTLYLNVLNAKQTYHPSLMNYLKNNAFKYVR